MLHFLVWTHLELWLSVPYWLDMFNDPHQQVDTSGIIMTKKPFTAIGILVMTFRLKIREEHWLQTVLNQVLCLEYISIIDS